jgi:hypothetical protein
MLENPTKSETVMKITIANVKFHSLLQRHMSQEVGVHH